MARTKHECPVPAERPVAIDYDYYRLQAERERRIAIAAWPAWLGAMAPRAWRSLLRHLSGPPARRTGVVGHR